MGVNSYNILESDIQEVTKMGIFYIINYFIVDNISKSKYFCRNFIKNLKELYN